MESFIVIENITSTPEWEQIFKTTIAICEEFSVAYPNGDFDEENPLLTGKLDFERIPDLSVSPWPNMADSSMYRGSLNDFSRNLFEQYMFNQRYNWLWNFSFYKSGVEILNVQDFTVCLIEPIPELVEMLNKQNIDLFNLK